MCTLLYAPFPLPLPEASRGGFGVVRARITRSQEAGLVRPGLGCFLSLAQNESAPTLLGLVFSIGGSVVTCCSGWGHWV